MMKRDAGFSLVELLCAVAILGVGLVGMTHGITTALSGSKEAERQTVAAMLAAGKIEEIRSESYLMEGLTEGEGGEGLENYQWAMSLTSSAPEGLYEVEVRVSSVRTEKVIYTLKTLLFDPPYTALTDPEALGTTGGAL
jgi:prepilin-type N-terminal cleavage/methylation domain-containing protein